MPSHSRLPHVIAAPLYCVSVFPIVSVMYRVSLSSFFLSYYHLLVFIFVFASVARFLRWFTVHLCFGGRIYMGYRGRWHRKAGIMTGIDFTEGAPPTCNKRVGWTVTGLNPAGKAAYNSLGFC